MANNGLEKFSIHIEDAPNLGFQNIETLANGIPADAETAARNYINQAFGLDSLSGFNQPTPQDGSQLIFQLKDQHEQAITGNKTLRFRQRINNISVYGSVVTIELDEENNFVSLASSLSLASTFNSIAAISPYEARSIAMKELELKNIPKDCIPLLYYYFDEKEQELLLVYIFKDLVLSKESVFRLKEEDDHLPEIVDLVIDASSGKIIKQLPRMACLDDEGTGLDEIGVVRRFGISKGQNGSHLMHDKNLNVKTYNFEFKSLWTQAQSLPGLLLESPPNWSASSISAHANACRVAAFFKNVLRRNGVDNKGKTYTSSINCVYFGNNKEWRNAAWFREQMVYGQIKVNNQFRTYASALDIVAHEVTHGVTDNTSRLEYLGESGALNESYSDIFGVLISNWEQEDIAQWDWKLGEDLSLNNLPIRDLSNPKAFNQPDHKDDYQDLPLDRKNDNGGVHINSGIHNKAAFNLANSIDLSGNYLFTKEELAHLFYLSLLRLAPMDKFSDSLNALLLSAKSLFKISDTHKPMKIKAIKTAFNDVGIE